MTSSNANQPVPPPRRTALTSVFDLFSSIWFGVFLLTLFFVYSSIGSAAIRIRQFFEKSEFEWFHWWPFDLLVALICVSMVAATIRRVPFNRFKMGTWLAHAGILILVIGSWIYFGAKIEGQTPVIRRQVVIAVPGAPEARLPALNGAHTHVDTPEGELSFAVTEIQPDWPILSGDDAGTRVYSVSVSVQTPDEQFVRQLLAGYPEYTEDILPGQGRAINAIGTRLVDENLRIHLDYEPQEWFFLNNTRALYVREAGQGEWVQRPIRGMARYHDRFGARDDVWLPAGVFESARPMSKKLAPEEDGDPLEEIPVRVTGYLRYAIPQARMGAGGDALNPMIGLRVLNPAGEIRDYSLSAFDARTSAAEGGQLAFAWLESAAALDELTTTTPRRLTIRIPGTDIEIHDALDRTARDEPDLAFAEIGDSGYAYRVQSLNDNIPVPDGRTISVAVVDVKTTGGEFMRWVADDPTATRDLTESGGMAGHDGVLELDAGIEMEYDPGRRPAWLTIAGGPAESELRALIRLPDGVIETRDLHVGESVDLGEGWSAVVSALMLNAREEVRPAIVPLAQRDPEAGDFFSMIRVEVGSGADAQSQWMQFNPYPLPGIEYSYDGRFRYRPETMTLSDGREVEFLYSRERRRLPAPVVLEDFQIASHIGGFTGNVSSIRNWTSAVRFQTPDGWTEPKSLSVNNPLEMDGFWFFQSSWDKPDPPGVSGASAGLNFTGLGVGNRRGVLVQLIGSILSVLGMIYAFYVKPAFLRRALGAQSETLTGNKAPAVLPEPVPVPAVAGTARRARFGWLATGVAVAALFVWAALRVGAGDSTQAGATPFARAVNLEPFERIAVQTEGRLKSFFSYAADTMRFVSGSRAISGQSPAFTYFDLMLRPEAYEDAEIVYVKNKPMRAQIARLFEGMPAWTPDRNERFLKTGLISPRLLELPQSRALLRQLGGDLVRTAKFVNAVENALFIRRAGFLAGQLAIIPPPGADLSTPWHSVTALQGGGAPMDDIHAGFPTPGVPGLDAESNEALLGLWNGLVAAWRTQDAPGVNAALTGLAEILPGLAPGIYPSQRRLAWESWYFKKGSLTWIWVVYMFSVIFLLMSVVYRWPAARALGLGTFIAAFALHTFALLLRWHISGRWPNSNMFEAVTTAAWFGGIFALLLEYFLRRLPMRNLFALGSACASMAALMAVHFLPLQLNPHIGNMMPVLHDVWLYIHTNVIIFSYCLIGMAAITALLYLGWRVIGGAPDYAAAGGAATLIIGGRPNSRGPSIGQVFDGATMILIELSFVLLWMGIIMGAIWADHSWGRPWGWDPKEVFALNTFVVFLALIHIRLKVRDKGLWTAGLALAGCAVMLFNWIVINFVISGLHSYA